MEVIVDIEEGLLDMLQPSLSGNYVPIEMQIKVE